MHATGADRLQVLVVVGPREKVKVQVDMDATIGQLIHKLREIEVPFGDLGEGKVRSKLGGVDRDHWAVTICDRIYDAGDDDYVGVALTRAVKEQRRKLGYVVAKTSTVCEA